MPKNVNEAELFSKSKIALQRIAWEFFERQPNELEIEEVLLFVRETGNYKFAIPTPDGLVDYYYSDAQIDYYVSLITNNPPEFRIRKAIFLESTKNKYKK
jgi:hypothetical protein